MEQLAAWSKAVQRDFGWCWTGVARYPLSCRLMQDSADRLCQLPQHKGLHQESIYTYSFCLLIEMVAKASAQNDGNIWTKTPQLFG
jgi:hypothetical protein